MRFAFLCNRRAGSGVFRDDIAGIAAELNGQIYNCPANPEIEAVLALRDGFDVLVAVGGDGTVSACASAIWKAKSPAILAVIPAGTLNHFAKDLGIPDFATAHRVLRTAHVRTVDIATVNGIPFVNNSGIGLYPVLVRKREIHRRHGVPRWVAFAIALCRVMIRMPLRRLILEADGQRLAHRTPFVFVGNNSYRVEGLSLGTRATLNGGVLGVCVSGIPGSLEVILLAVRALFRRLKEQRDFFNIAALHLTVRSPHSTLQVSLDGELRRLHTPLDYRIHPGGLRVLSPPLSPQ